jgi:DNA-damage-inducible protein J
MNQTVVTIKLDTKTKKEAQKVAKDLGLSLSSVVKMKLKEFIRNKSIEARLPETPNQYLQSVMKQAKENRAKGNASPVFDNTEEAVKYLEEQGI